MIYVKKNTSVVVIHLVNKMLPAMRHCFVLKGSKVIDRGDH